MMMVHTPHNTPRADVFVNGELVKCVLMFDVERGKCVVARQPITVARMRNGEQRIMRHTIYGDVTFKPLK